MANPSMNTIQDDLVMVYKETVINSKLQFEKPISSALATPVQQSFFQLAIHGTETLEVPVTNRYQNLITDASKYLTIKWHETTARGY
jgi:hypothetical protein